MLTEYRKARLEKGLRQVDVATLTGLRQERISLLERGMPPSESEAVRLQKVLGIPNEATETESCKG